MSKSKEDAMRNGAKNRNIIFNQLGSSHLCKISILVGITTLTIMTGSAQADTSGPLSAAQVRQVQEICTDTMHLRRGVVEYDACIETLSLVLSNRNETQRLVRSYDACATRKEGTPEFAMCVLNQMDTDSADRSTKGGSEIAPARDIQHSYIDSNADERRMLAENACAQLGLVPGGVGFGSCVSNLNVNLRNASDPS
jgi:hypothetical protein